MKKDRPVVSACIITYNQKDYIVECIEGVLKQKVSFPYEIIIGDDASSDGTSEICQYYEKKYPKIIKYFRREKNLGIIGNWVESIKNCDGKYIAFCEGDDFWTDPNKLEEQVRFMEKNQDYIMGFHSVCVKNEVPGINYQYPKPTKDTLRFRDLLFKHYIPTCSLLVRNNNLGNKLPNWLDKCKMIDIPLELMLADKGMTFFLDKEYAVYRKNSGGITLNQEQIKNGRKAYLYVYKNLNTYFRYKYWLLFSLIISKIYLGYIKDLFR